MSHRKERLEKELQKLINAIFHGDIEDSRISGIQITKVRLTSDMKLTKLYFSDYDKEIPLNKILELLNKCSGYIKKQIAGANIMRTIPQIVFEYDNTSERVNSIEKVFQTIAAEKRNHNYYDDDNDSVYYDNDEIMDEDLEEYDDYDDEFEDDDLDFNYQEVDDDDD